MSAKLLDGKLLASRLKSLFKKEVATLKEKTGHAPSMANIMVGSDAIALSYANSQKKVANEIGIAYKLINLPKDISQKEIIKYIEQLNKDKAVHGIMIYKLLPSKMDYHAIANCVDIAKDLEGMNIANIGKLISGEAKIIPCTAAAVMEHIKSTQVKLRGKEVVIVGRSEIVGKPLILLLLAESATVTVCHSATHEAGKLSSHVGRADILVAAVGKAGFIKGEWIKKGSIVVDVGINKVDGKIVGDVEFSPACKKAAYITPVPGGVGPVTVMMLMKNCIEAFKLQVKGS